MIYGMIKLDKTSSISDVSDKLNVGLVIFLSCRKFGTFDEDEVWGALTSEAREDMTLAEPATVQQIIKSWATKDRLPVVTVTRDYQCNSACVEQVGVLRGGQNTEG
jgi:aminopeptidase N